MKTKILILIALLQGCTPATEGNVTFNLTLDNNKFRCNDSNGDIIVIDARLFVHDLAFQDEAGAWHSFSGAQGDEFQKNLFLLDFVSAQNSCSASVTLFGSSKVAKPHAVKFTVGVPFELNHANPMQAKPPLDDTSMHWHWQSGYKFARIEFSKSNDESMRYHLGSLQCKGEMTNITGCDMPNRPQIVIENYDPSKPINLDLTPLLTDAVGERLTCMGGSSKPWCDKADSWIGLNPEIKQKAFVQ